MEYVLSSKTELPDSQGLSVRLLQQKLLFDELMEALAIIGAGAVETVPGF